MRSTAVVAASFAAVAANAPNLPANVTAPKVPANINCPYSQEALKSRAEGTATITVHITDEGEVSRVDVVESTGTKALDDSAVTCAEAWRFKPALLNGKPVASRKMYAIRFIWGSGPKPNQSASSPVANPSGSQVR